MNATSGLLIVQSEYDWTLSQKLRQIRMILSVKISSELDMDLIHSWIGLGQDWVRMFRELYGLDWIELGGMTVTLVFLISNFCSTVDAVSLKL